MHKKLLLTSAVLTSIALAAAQPSLANQYLPPPQIDASGNVFYPGGPTIGKFNPSTSVFAPSGPTTSLTHTAVGAGAVSRPLNDKLGENPSILDYGAKCDNATDDSPAIQAATNANKIVTVPAAGNYCIMKEGVSVPTGHSFIGLAGVGVNFNGGANCFVTTQPIDMFTAQGVGVIFDGVCMLHNGAAGRAIYSPPGTGGAMQILYSGILGTSDTNPDDLILLQTSDNVVRGNGIGNSRPTSGFAVNLLAPTGSTQIANRIEFNTFTANPNTIGPPVVMHSGQSIHIGGDGITTGSFSRQEGPMILGNQFIAQNTNIFVQSVLSMHVIGNELDQAWSFNTVFGPTGFGISDVSFDGNWISNPVQTTTGLGVSDVGTGGSIGNISFTGNHFAFSAYGIAFTSQVSNVSIVGNNFSAMASIAIALNGVKGAVVEGNTCSTCTTNLDLVDGTTVSGTTTSTGGPFYIGANLWDPAGSFALTMTDPTKFSFSPQNKRLATDYAAGTTGTISAAGCTFLNIPHGLAGTPNLDKIRLNARTLTGGFQNLTTNIAAVDNTNITAQVCVGTVVTSGTIRVSAAASL